MGAVAETCKKVDLEGGFNGFVPESNSMVEMR